MVFYLISLKVNLSEAIAFLAASLSMTIYSEIMARKLKSPAITFLIGGFIPLVPGSGVYYTMYGLIKNDMQMTVQKGIQTFIIAGAIAVGILLGSTICQIYFSKKKKHEYHSLEKLKLGGKK